MLVFTRLSKYLDHPSHNIEHYNINIYDVGYINNDFIINANRIEPTIYTDYTITFRRRTPLTQICVYFSDIITKNNLHIKYINCKLENNFNNILDNTINYEYFTSLSADIITYLSDIKHANIFYRDNSHAGVHIGMYENQIKNYTRSLNNTTLYLFYDQNHIERIEILNTNTHQFTIDKYVRI